MLLRSVAVLLAALVAAGTAHADGRRDGGMIARHAERLGLDEDTRAEIQRIARDSHEARDELRSEARETRRQMFDLLNAENPDEGAIMALADRLTELDGQKRRHRLSTALRIRALLSAEQRAELSAIQTERRERRERRRAERMAAIQTACAADLQSHCPDVAEGRKRGRCLYEHREELSDACRGVLRPPHERHRGRRRGDGF